MGKKLIVTGSLGLIGSEVSEYFLEQGWEVHGLDNNQRAVFFGLQGDNSWNKDRLAKFGNAYQHHQIDIRDREGILGIIPKIQPDAIVHTAAQPSHDRAAAIPFEDFDTNAVGTFNLLESLRRYSTNVPFVHLSTNKVYGDAPNFIKMKELETRFDYDDATYEHGIAESFSIDQSKHSLFGSSKVSADISVQEYGRYFDMPTTVLRGGCLTGPNHAGVELHGFLSYLIKCNIEEKEYTIFGYKGKQVRDNIHSLDVARFCEAFIKNPRVAEVYNIGGGKENSVSILEAFQLISNISGIPMKYTYNETNRIGDHICYYSDLRKMKAHYPSWGITKSLEDVFNDIYNRYMEAKN
ncbi:MAG: CDP-paratose 2-epimerase [Bacteroidota bacterium]|jgi:CDP-paratose 2-epimerase